MCLNPIQIKNPNAHDTVLSKNRTHAHALHKSTMPNLLVPCGHCAECIAYRQESIVQRVQVESQFNYLFFCTLTYDNAHLPFITSSTGIKYYYASFAHIDKLMHTVRRLNPFERPIRTLVVSERGGEKGRPHFHIIFFIPKDSKDNEFTPLQMESQLYWLVRDNWKIKVNKSRKYPIYEQLFQYHENWDNGILRRNFDLHYVVDLNELDNCQSLAFYVTKYLLKEDKRLERLHKHLRLSYDKDESTKIYNTVKTKVTMSKFLGLCKMPNCPEYDNELQVEHQIFSSITEDLKRGEFPNYKDTCSGNSFPLARFYKRRYLDPNKLGDMLSTRLDLVNDEYISSSYLTYSQYVDKQAQNAKKYKALKDDIYSGEIPLEDTYLEFEPLPPLDNSIIHPDGSFEIYEQNNFLFTE